MPDPTAFTAPVTSPAWSSASSSAPRLFSSLFDTAFTLGSGAVRGLGRLRSGAPLPLAVPVDVRAYAVALRQLDTGVGHAAATGLDAGAAAVPDLTILMGKTTACRPAPFTPAGGVTQLRPAAV
ncbi:hypothetical protein [Streptomyces sp. NPDC040750]|uniref:hypothetical protein n=1 Tax=Streptomyces sp. NPDC040750 TaxID=3154491 RepID=UPI0033C91B31